MTPQLKYYTQANNFYAGSNTPQFRNLEFWIDSNLEWITESKKFLEAEDYPRYYKFMPKSIVSVGLFGEASAGKTSALRLASKILDRPVILLNGAQFQNSSFEETILQELYNQTSFVNKKPGYYCYDFNSNILPGTKYRNLIPKVIFLIDECHELPKKVQTKLLSLLEGPIEERVITIEYSDLMVDSSPGLRQMLNRGQLDKSQFGRSICLNGAIFAFATTDPSKMLQPLVTRLHRIVFDRYSLDDVVNIIKLKYPMAETSGAELLAKCAKFIPREAIRMANQIETVYKNLSLESCSKYILEVINMDINGLDSIDYRLLRFLIGNKKELSTRQKIDLETNKGLLAHLLTKQTKTESEQRAYLKSLATVGTLSNIESGEYTPKGKDDIAMSCSLYDIKDVDRRLSYLQSLGIVEKTSRGIIYLPNHQINLDESKLL